MKSQLSKAGAAIGAVLGLGAEYAIEELTGFDIMNGLLALIGAGAGMLRIDRQISDSLLNLLNQVPVDEQDTLEDIRARIKKHTQGLDELDAAFEKLLEAGIKAKMA